MWASKPPNPSTLLRACAAVQRHPYVPCGPHSEAGCCHTYCSRYIGTSIIGPGVPPINGRKSRQTATKSAINIAMINGTAPKEKSIPKKETLSLVQKPITLTVAAAMTAIANNTWNMRLCSIKEPRLLKPPIPIPQAVTIDSKTKTHR